MTRGYQTPNLNRGPTVRIATLMFLWLIALCPTAPCAEDIYRQFVQPPESARPWVYWYFMDGNLSKEGMTADLEAMKHAGIGGAIFLEVGIGIPRGPVQFMSPEWRELFKHAVTEADRLGLEIALGAGPGWCGAGGPWVEPELSMQHLVCSETTTTGDRHFDAPLPRPGPRAPFFGLGTLTPQMRRQWEEFYRDAAVLAFPTPAGSNRIADIDEKALYHRAPYSSQPGVKSFLPAPADYPALPAEQCIHTSQVLDLTSKLGPDGRLVWDVPPGNWTIMRFGRTITGQTTRPAPAPGLGFETDKFNKAALDEHFKAFTGELLKAVGPIRHPGRGLTTLHFDSWEMSSQNWSSGFRDEFRKRRGYDPLRYLPAMAGSVVESNEISERFLWDLRQTAQELVIQNQAEHLKELGHQHGLRFSIEPYDLNPCADLELGSVADVPMCEFWSKGFGFPTEFSCIEAVSIAHTLGRPVIAAEAFTANGAEQWQQYPASMKAQGDWALCAGINRFTFHRYQHQPKLDQFPGMTMGPYGVHWERTQTWWDLVPAYHLYLTRCQQMLRSGLPVADILYLTPEGAPHVFRPPGSALTADLPDRLGYNFDGCAPSTLIEHASVRDGRVVFPGGMSYRVLVMPRVDTITPSLLRKVKQLLEAGATVIGAPPRKSPGLADYPACDEQVKRLAVEIWGEGTPAAQRAVGKGHLVYDSLSSSPQDMYPHYTSTAKILADMKVRPDFESDASLRYTHRHIGEADLYFIANRDSQPTSTICRFRVSGRQPEWWDPLTGERRDLAEFKQKDGLTLVPIRLEGTESGFVVFRRASADTAAAGSNFPEPAAITTIARPWEVAFDPKWGGPEEVTFTSLEDWAKRPEPGIRNYSGKAVYRTTFDFDRQRVSTPDSGKGSQTAMFIGLGKVKNMASVRLNGKDLGTAWCAPWRLPIPAGTLREHGNKLEVTVANLWINRLIGDSALAQEKRLTSTTWNPFKADSPLQESGLLGPVTLLSTGQRPRQD